MEEALWPPAKHSRVIVFVILDKEYTAVPLLFCYSAIGKKVRRDGETFSYE